MATKLRVLSALCALVAGVIVVWQTNPARPVAAGSVELRSTAAPLSDVATTIKWPVIETVNPRHHQVGDHQVRLEGFQFLERFVAVAGLLDIVTPGLDIACDPFAQGPIVIHDKHSGAGFGHPLSDYRRPSGRVGSGIC